jgi:hypothetical protein
MLLINKPFKLGAKDRETELNVSDLRRDLIIRYDEIIFRRNLRSFSCNSFKKTYVNVVDNFA